MAKSKTSYSHLDPNAPIGIFDSGVGGLTVAKTLRQMLPQENMIYYGDTKHLPYGDKSVEAIQEYAIRIVNFLLQEECKCIVVACNSATAAAFNVIQKRIQDSIILVDVISPVAELVSCSIHHRVGVIATKATVGSNLYKKSINKKNKKIEVRQLATPLLVPVIEEGLSESNISEALLHHYLDSKKLQHIDALILGCTHYPLVSQEIRKFYNGKAHVEVIDSPSIVSHEVRERLRAASLLKQDGVAGKMQFYLSDITPNFKKTAKKFFGKSLHFSLKTLDASYNPADPKY